MTNGDGPFDVHFDPNVFGCCDITTAITILGQKTSYEMLWMELYKNNHYKQGYFTPVTHLFSAI